MRKKRVPVTILTGYLGSGKTTLLNRLIAGYPDQKFAVIENEFGDIGIDGELVNKDAGGLYELSNGCVCCDLGSDLAKTLNKLVLSDFDFSHVIIEATGVADPAGIISRITGDLHLAEFFQVNAVLALVDACAFERQLEADWIAGRQVAYADCVLVNKCDLVSKEELSDLEDLLRGVALSSEIRKTTFCDDVDGVLGLGKETHRRVEQAVETLRTHAKGIKSFSFERGEVMDIHLLDAWLRDFLASNPHLFRVKGVLALAGTPRKIVVQSVMDRHTMIYGSEWKKGERRSSKMVFIGRDLDSEELERGMKGCFAE